VATAFADVRHAEDNRPAASLDRAGLIPVARTKAPDLDPLRAAAAPSLESRRTAQAEGDDRLLVLARVGQLHLDAGRSFGDVERPLEQLLVVVTGDLAVQRHLAAVKSRGKQLVLIDCDKIDSGADRGPPTLSCRLLRSEV